MLLSKDQDFTDALESSEALGKRLVVLEKRRRHARSGLKLFGAAFLITLIASVVAYFSKDHQTSFPWFTAPVMGLAFLQQQLAAVTAQSEIRTLLGMKKLLGFDRQMS